MAAWIALLAGGCYVCLCLYLYVRQRSLLYFPHPPSRTEEAAVHWLQSHGQRLLVQPPRLPVAHGLDPRRMLARGLVRGIGSDLALPLAVTGLLGLGVTVCHARIGP